MPTWINNLLADHPSIKWKVRVMCLIVIAVSLGCIAGHVSDKPLLYSYGLNLGMSVITAICNILMCSALLMLVPEHDHEHN